jgi:hypothetical protein
MAEIKKPQKVLPIVGLIFENTFDLDPALKRLTGLMGKAVLNSHVIHFTHTTYYNREMGDKLSRQWWVFEQLMSPDVLVDLKHTTNNIENGYLNKKGGRKINIDPGLLSLSNLILASTKNYSHRIYLGKGIYGEVTLIFKNNAFNPLSWTYPDYQEESTLEFFSKAREILKKELSQR